MLREFFNNARPVHEATDDEDLLSKMSPLLQGTVAVAANSMWLAQIWFLNGLGSTRLEKDFIAALAMKLGLSAYIVHERMPIGQLYVLRRGMVVKLYRFLGKGRVWGEDALLDARHFEIVDHSQAVALTFVETYLLRRPDFAEVAHQFPTQMKTVAKRMRRIVLQRYLLLYLARHLQGSFARSFVCRSAAEGYAYVESWKSELSSSGLLAETHHRRARQRLSLSHEHNEFGPPIDAFSRLHDDDRAATASSGSSYAPNRMDLAHRKLEDMADQVRAVLHDMKAAQAKIDAQLQVFDQRLEALEEHASMVEVSAVHTRV